MYFIASSALANAEIHAAASKVVIRLEPEGREVQLTVLDDGIGGAQVGRGTGLTNMRDRAETVGGRLEVDSPRGGPTRISAVMPVEEAHVVS